MTELEQLREEFKKFREWGYNRYDSALNAGDVVFAGDSSVRPCIHVDQYGDASHIFIGNEVLFFESGDIYIS